MYVALSVILSEKWGALVSNVTCLRVDTERRLPVGGHVPLSISRITDTANPNLFLRYRRLIFISSVMVIREIQLFQWKNGNFLNMQQYIVIKLIKLPHTIESVTMHVSTEQRVCSQNMYMLFLERKFRYSVMLRIGEELFTNGVGFRRCAQYDWSDAMEF